ncbi:hypothetical protein [Desulfamplus magnetovallimortis]|uniref:hypothetical protein n=1 Tax=Desulfamplus magnetovallimortis TaxID=1246637 RepID=UPI00111A5B25|nr:hypothetical protein [Desulfamplus magnetovallimortis]
MILINMILFSITYAVYLRPYENVDLTYRTYLLSDSHGLALADLMENDGIFNFSAGSDSYVDMLRKLKYLINHSHVKKIILTVDDHQLSPYRNLSNNLDRSLFFASRQDFSNIFEFFKCNLKRYCVLLNPKSRDILDSWFESLFTDRKNVRKWKDVPENEKDRRSLARVNVQFRYKKQADLLLTSLNQIIALCRMHDIEIVGIKYPLSKNFIRVKGDRRFFADDVLNYYDLKVYDFEELFKERDDYFLNTDHLNSEGGRAFAEVLLNHVIRHEEGIYGQALLF